MLTVTEVYWKVRNHLLSQGERSVDIYYYEDSEEVEGMCRYRLKAGDKTLMCAVGCLIPDDQYQESFEDRSAILFFDEWIRGHPYCDVTTRLDGLVGVVDTSDPNMLSLVEQLQHIHDNKPVNTWEEELDELLQDSEYDIGEEPK